MRYAGKRKYQWSHNIAYLVGLMTSDGCLSKDGRHLDITSVDTEQLENFLCALGRKISISEKKNQHPRTAYRIQFSDVALYDLLLKVGLTPNKSLTISNLKVPNKYYSDFLRGLFDGDGSTNAFWDTRWKSSYMFYTRFASGSMIFVKFLQSKNCDLIGIGKGSILKTPRAYMLSYAKNDSRRLYDYMYYKKDLLCLERKRTKLESFIKIDKVDRIL